MKLKLIGLAAGVMIALGSPALAQEKASDGSAACEASGGQWSTTHNFCFQKLESGRCKKLSVEFVEDEDGCIGGLADLAGPQDTGAGGEVTKEANDDANASRRDRQKTGARTGKESRSRSAMPPANHNTSRSNKRPGGLSDSGCEGPEDTSPGCDGAVATPDSAVAPPANHNTSRSNKRAGG